MQQGIFNILPMDRLVYGQPAAAAVAASHASDQRLSSPG